MYLSDIFNQYTQHRIISQESINFKFWLIVQIPLLDSQTVISFVFVFAMDFLILAKISSIGAKEGE